MSVRKELRVNISGSVPDDWNDEDYEIILAKLRLFCVEHRLELEELVVLKNE